ncbi:MAG TPA: SDR family oxidoreductase, partial [Candidatus Thermoplasmatota archaeon]|nr:SDR family oxidoreductase [Candidatus Thermoplasmatota archaeon]
MRDVAVVTGANSGIGLEVARGLARRGLLVVMGVRDVAKGEAARAGVLRDVPDAAIEVERLDLFDYASVRRFARAVQERHPAIRVLVDNAGLHTARRETNAQGHERTFATNHLGHFLLTHELLPALRAAGGARVVVVASEAHRFGRIRFHDLMRARRWSGIFAYNQSKLANVMFAFALARRLEGTGATANAVHPGSVRTGWARGRDSGFFRYAAFVAGPFLIGPERGARTPLRVATDPALAGVTGRYFRWGRE